MKKIGVIGCGKIGIYIIDSLLKRGEHEVYVYDPNVTRLALLHSFYPKAPLVTEKKLPTRTLDPGIDLFIGCVPGSVGFSVLKEVISLGKPYIDCSFMPTDELNEAKKLDVSSFVLLDMGIAPGISNMCVADGIKSIQATNVDIYVGGIPQVPKWPFFHSATWSIEGLFDEYTRPAFYISNRKKLQSSPLFETRNFSFSNGLDLEAFRSDGLRSLLNLAETENIENMNEYTLRWPGHLDFIRALDSIDLLEPALTQGLHHELEDQLIMDITISGEKITEYTIYELNYQSEKGKFTAMSTTTGEGCLSAFHLIEKKLINLSPGVHFPEEIIFDNPDAFSAVLKYIKSKNIHLYKTF